MKIDSVICYGAGAQGETVRLLLNEYGLKLSFFCDINEKLHGKYIDKVKVLSINELKGVDKSTPVIIGIGAPKIDTIKQVKLLLIKLGFIYIFYSVVDYINSYYPHLVGEKIYITHWLEVTPVVGCKIKCKACPQEVFIKKYCAKENNKNLIMSLDTFKKCLESVPKSVVINFSGFTEPFLNPECADMLLYAFQQGFRVRISTTLVGMTNNDFEKIKEIEFDAILPHLPDSDNNCIIPITDDYLELLVKFLQYFLPKKYDSGRSVITFISIHGKINEKVSGLLTHNGIDISGYKNLGVTSLGTRAGNLNVDKNEMPKSLSILKPNYKKGSIVCKMFHFVSEYINKDDLLHLECFKLSNLLPNGDLALCSMDFGLKHVMGNLLKEKYEYIFSESKNWLDFSKGITDENYDIICRHCNCGEERSYYKDIATILEK